MYYAIPIFVVIVAAILLYEFVFKKKLQLSNWKVDEKVVPYYDKLFSIMKPYISNEFAQSMLLVFKKVLGDCMGYYNGIIAGTVHNNEDSFYKRILDSNTDNDVIEYICLMHILWFINNRRSGSFLSANEEERIAIDALYKSSKERLQKYVELIPDCIWDYYRLKKNDFVQFTK
ncbi:MAG: hypothetical protein IJ033_02350 [Clostridia bacterium]|nr:hypothetical protein [Clostridia bacterium]